VTGAISYGQSPAYSASTLPAPSYVSNGTVVTVPANQAIHPSDPSTAVYINEVNLNPGGTLTLHHGLYVVGYFNSNGASTLYIDDDEGPVVMWVLSSLSPSGTVSTKSGRASGFWLVYNGMAGVNNNTNNSFTGVLFAPAAEVILNYVVTGAVVGGKVTLNGPSRVHFDVALRCP
jgi:hypothetical protein